MKRVLLSLLLLVFVMSFFSVAMASSATSPSEIPAMYKDVPANHWSYDALKRLSKDGIVNGYGDGTFRGNAMMSRYEMAVIVANAMTKMEKANDDDQKLLTKLATEYAAELKDIGVRVGKLEEFKKSTLRTGFDIFSYYEADDPSGSNPKVKGNDGFQARYRLWLDGDVNDNTKFFARFTSGTSGIGYSWSSTAQNSTMTVDRFNVDSKNAFGFDDITVGRMGFMFQGGAVGYKSGGTDGIKLSKKLGEDTVGNLGILNVRQEPTGTTHSQAIEYAEFESQVNSKLKLAAWGINNNVSMAASDSALNYSYKSSRIFGFSAYQSLGGQWSLLGEYDTAHLSNPVSVSSSPTGYQIQLVRGGKTSSTHYFYGNPFTFADVNTPGATAISISYRNMHKGLVPNGLGPNNTFNLNPNWLVNGKQFNGNDDMKGWYLSYQWVLAKDYEMSLDYQILKFADTGAKFDKFYQVLLNVFL